MWLIILRQLNDFDYPEINWNKKVKSSIQIGLNRLPIRMHQLSIITRFSTLMIFPTLWLLAYNLSLFMFD